MTQAGFPSAEPVSSRPWSGRLTSLGPWGGPVLGPTSGVRDGFGVGQLTPGLVPHDGQTVRGRMVMQLCRGTADQPCDGVPRKAGMALAELRNDGVKIVGHRFVLRGRSGYAADLAQGSVLSTVYTMFTVANSVPQRHSLLTQ